MARRVELLAGLDIGTARVAVVVADCDSGAPEIVGVGTAPSEGLRKGVVANIDATVQAIARAVREAETAAGCEIHSVFAGVGGGHIKAFNSHGVVAVKSAEVALGDVDRVLDAARAVALPLDRQILHVLPQQFLVDGQDGIREPVGMSGVRLEARVHIVSAAVPVMQNVIKCCQRAGLHAADVVLTPLAAAEAVLSVEERDLGVAMVDLGAGTTDVLIYQRGSVVHTAVLPLGGNYVTNDLAAGLRTPFREAELLKRRHGCANTREVGLEEEVEVPGVGGRPARVVARRAMCDIIEARVEEIFSLVREQLSKAGYDENLACGLVLTGGGALMRGSAAVAERIFRLPVRVGVPIGIAGVPEVSATPEFAAAAGLVVFGSRAGEGDRPAMHGGVIGRMRSRMVGWFREFF